MQRDMAEHSNPKASPVRARGLRRQVQGPEGPLTILDGVDLEVGAGEAVAILGASGSGKSTLLGLLAGLDLPSAGEVWLLDHRLNGMDEDARARLRAGRVGFVFQSFQLLPGMSALENTMLPLELSGARDAPARAREVLAEVGLGRRLHHYPQQLSGGEQQRVAIARAFAPEPDVMFADEPTGNLDSRTGARIIDLLFGLRERHGTALVLVTHDPALARRCDRRLQLEAGVIREDTP
ncbi:MAG: ATP-binding cassette domain-containing protein [Gammaproteobacteria bacterium]|nr:MAG: ATP-binding cassette domain-containing protein [Gammaproteobacteria bacterium]